MKTRVLIADDSAFLRKRISEILSSSDEIVLIGTAKNGKEAIKKAIYQNPDVILLDLMMPKINGLEAFRRIMAENPTPTIILSSISPQTLDSSVQALLIGAFDYILKPGTLGAKKLPDFRKNLIEKILLASNSRFNKIYGKMEYEKDSTGNLPFRQQWVDEVFEFGKYLKEIKPSKIQSKNVFKAENYVEYKKKPKQVTDNKISKEDIEGQSELQKEYKNRLHENLDKPKKIESDIQKRGKSTSFDDKDNIDVLYQNLLRKEKRREKKSDKSVHKQSILKEIEHKKDIRTQKIRIEDSQPKKYFKTISGRKIPKIDSKIVVIGASVGGPKALRMILQGIPRNFPYPIIVVQHLNEHFISPLAQYLNKNSEIKVKVAEHYEILRPSTVYFAPSGRHISISTKKKSPCIILYKGKPVNSCVPSVDVLFESASEIYKNKVIAILLTGMGEDGVNGMKKIHENGGITISESEETAILFGMPKFAIEEGVVDRILPNYKIRDFLVQKSYY
ncbi:MAG: Chemotaxis response regulator protein-glutamate methylesterase [Promethearchaeota archaeon]|nr:MAG: Chemotaxis response regulator protein-glutamate methylesterase [Candidatus Lokiarchaeota archaeon]